MDVWTTSCSGQQNTVYCSFIYQISVTPFYYFSKIKDRMVSCQRTKGSGLRIRPDKTLNLHLTGHLDLTRLLVSLGCFHPHPLTIWSEWHPQTPPTHLNTPNSCQLCSVNINTPARIYCCWILRVCFRVFLLGVCVFSECVCWVCGVWTGQTWFLLPHFMFFGVFLAVCSVVEVQLNGHKLPSSSSIPSFSLFLSAVVFIFLSSHFHLHFFSLFFTVRGAVWGFQICCVSLYQPESDKMKWQEVKVQTGRRHISLLWVSDEAERWFFLLRSLYLRLTNTFEQIWIKKLLPVSQSVSDLISGLISVSDPVCEALLDQTLIALGVLEVNCQLQREDAVQHQHLVWWKVTKYVYRKCI